MLTVLHLHVLKPLSPALLLASSHDIVGPVTLGVCEERGTRTLGPLLSGTRVQIPGSQLTLPIRVVVSLAECVPGAAWVGGSLWRMLACPLCAGSAGHGPAFGLSVCPGVVPCSAEDVRVRVRLCSAALLTAIRSIRADLPSALLLSNSMKISHALLGHPRWVGHGGEV